MFTYLQCSGEHLSILPRQPQRCPDLFSKEMSQIHMLGMGGWGGNVVREGGGGGGGQERSQNACVWGVFVYVKGVQSHRVDCGDNMKANGAW